MRLFDVDDYRRRELRMKVVFTYPDTGEIRERNGVTDLQKVMRSEGGYLEKERRHCETSGYDFRSRTIRMDIYPETPEEFAYFWNP